MLAVGDTVIVAVTSDGASASQVVVNVWSKESMELIAGVIWESTEMEYWPSRFEMIVMKASDDDVFCVWVKHAMWSGWWMFIFRKSGSWFMNLGPK